MKNGRSSDENVKQNAKNGARQPARPQDPLNYVYSIDREGSSLIDIGKSQNKGPWVAHIEYRSSTIRREDEAAKRC